MRRPRLRLTPLERASLHDAARAEAMRIIARRLARALARAYEGDEDDPAESGVRKAGAS